MNTEMMSPVSSGMLASAPKRRRTASIDMFARYATENTEKGNTRRSSSICEPRAKRPRYTRGLLWATGDEFLSSTARWSLSADPAPDVPPNKFLNAPAIRTLADHPHLFRIKCPVNVDQLESLLTDHPNQPLVESVCRSLREGFWPWADTKHGTYPTIWDNSDRPLKTQGEVDFVHAQINKEVMLGRYSQPFGPELHPGMYSSPLHTIPKPGSDGYRLINDQSAGDFAPNSMISRGDVTGTCMDGIKEFGASLLAYRREHGDDVQLIIWKSDIHGAYRNMPIHPLYQLKQVVSAGDKRYVDHCNCFGNRASYIIWLSFASLVTWIAICHRLIRNLKVYVDDNASFARVGDVLYYPPYKHYFPTEQTRLLLLWDELGIPHEEKKQIYGPVVPFIGFDVDPNAMTVSISDERKAILLARVTDFAQAGKRHTLKEFLAIAGHINWYLTVFPLLRPCLSALYAKTAGKTQMMAPVRVNNAIRDELSWFVRHAQQSDGIYLLRSVAWDPNTDHVGATVCYTDACPGGMAYWFPELNVAYQCRVPPSHETVNIFYYEALAVTCAMLQQLETITPRFVVYTDNTNTVDIWDSLKASGPYNHLLITAIDYLRDHHIDSRVLHVPGFKNTVADALSRFNNAYALQLVPGLKIYSFLPPHGTLGAPKK
jgi:hypothetical protein